MYDVDISNLNKHRIGNLYFYLDVAIAGPQIDERGQAHNVIIIFNLYSWVITNWYSNVTGNTRCVWA